MQVRSDRTYLFEHPPQTVWSAIENTESYRSWWPWLRRFSAEGLVAGDRWECSIRPPMPYVLRLTIALCEVEEGQRITAVVDGDIRGEASVELFPTTGGCSVRLVSALAPAGQPLRTIMRVSPWLARFGHDWVLDTGVRQFRRAL